MAEQDKDFLNMSDDDLDNVDLATLDDEVAEPVSNDEGIADEQADDESEAAGQGQQESTDEESNEEGLLTESVTKDDALDSDEEEESTSKESKPESEDKEVVEEPVDYKAQIERLMTPFKANGRDIAVKSVDDAIALMQMGANYNKKMAALKPNLKLMKLLENNGLLDEAKIGYLIDLEKKNPDAINKLVKDSGIDPLEIDADKAGDYKPNSYTVDDREFELDAVLDELQGTPTYNQTLDIVSNKWDGASKQVIANSPQLLKVINSHVQSGIYELINKEIESERMFGRLEGMSDIEAYRQVGDSLQARGGFNHLSTQVASAPKPVIVQPKPKQVDSDKLREKKRAASSTKVVGASQIQEDYNPLSLSDDAFSKLVNDKYL